MNNFSRKKSELLKESKTLADFAESLRKILEKFKF